MRTTTTVRMLVAIGALIFGACGADAAPPPTTAPAISTSSSPSAPATTTTITTATTSTTVPSRALPDLLLAHGGGITLVGPGVDWFDDGPVGVAHSDLSGGLVFQRAGEPPGPIERLSEPGAEPAVVVSSSEGERISVVDVFPVNGVATLAYTLGTRLPNDCADTDVECGWDHDVTYLMLLDLDGGTTLNLGIVGAFESDWHAYRFGDGVYASLWSEYGAEAVCVGWGPIEDLIDAAVPDRWLSARDRCRVGPAASCPGDPLCSGVARPAVAPDGSRLAYVGGSYPSPVTIVEMDAASGAVFRTTELSGVEEFPGWLAYDGIWLVLGRLDTDGSELAPIVVRPDGVLEELEFTGRVSFWKEGSQP